MPEPLSLEDELVALGRGLRTDPPRDHLVEDVLARLAVARQDAFGHDSQVPRPPTDTAAGEAAAVGSTDPAPRHHRMPRRLGWAVAAAVVLVLALIPPVRAAVVELLRIGGVVVREEPTPSAPTAPSGNTSTTSRPVTPGAGAPADRVTPVSRARAEQLVGGAIELPGLLGRPTTLGVGHDGRVVEITWEATATRGAVRLDVFVGSLSWGYLKTVWQSVTPVSVGGRAGVWLGSNHLVEWVDRSGGTHSEAPRLAGPTLVWVAPAADGDLTYRLEGLSTLELALEAARSGR